MGDQLVPIASEIGFPVRDTVWAVLLAALPACGVLNAETGQVAEDDGKRWPWKGRRAR